MKAWSNIEITPQDSEIIKINSFEKKLGELPYKVIQIRELITRFEVCHFKYQQHIKKIKDSIVKLQPVTNPNIIGKNHVKNGEDTWKNDKTGRSLIGQQYIWALQKWLEDDSLIKESSQYNKKQGQQIEILLRDRNPIKKRLIRLLLARLTWNWKLYEELQHGKEHKDLELQVCRMDICRYNFPTNLDILLQAIGEMKVSDKFEGCGSFNAYIKTCIKKELSILNKWLKSFVIDGKSNKEELIKAWLIACLAKTLKEQVNLTTQTVELPN